MAESTQIAQEIGAKIRYLRLKRGMSQETLALNCDMNPAFLGHVERGMRCPTVNTLQRICNGLDITLTELILTQSGEEQTPDDPRNASVQHVLDVLPQGVAVGPVDEHALDGGVVNEFGLSAHIGVPLGEVHLHVGDLFDFLLVVLSHSSHPLIQNPGLLGRSISVL